MKLFIILIISCIYLIDSVNSKSKYYDGPDRAYKFGYSIEGNQHRQETKDENGIIMGEFGFITADGVYHVTGYGTDENGNFKILYMKNIKIGLPGEPGQQPAPKNIGGSVPQQSAPVAPKSAPAPVQKQSVPEIKTPIASDTPSCGSCIIPVIEKEVNKAVKQTVSSGANAVAQAPRIPSGGSLGGGLAAVGGPGAGPGRTVGGGVPGASPSGSGAGRTPGGSGGLAQKSPAQSLAGGAAGDRSAIGAQGRQGKALGLGFPGSSDPTSLSGGNAQQPNIDIRTLSSQNGGSPSSPSSLSNAGAQSRVGASLSSGAGSPSAVSQSNRGNNQNTFASDPSSLTGGSGRPSGSSSSNQGGNSGSPSKTPLDLSQMQNIINGILYKFNYTVGYHGHHEEGDHIGNKDGGYYSIGRDGLHRSVDYTANENGFQPHIKLRPVNDPNEIPKPETEKEAGLKGYEFKWFNLGDANHNSKRQ